ncbi:hypothetical protein [Paenirhodobacter populi]|uniref:Uncharacterized protein n=1 Tax=Paenirhodobacter populi TaxID=2306993 RepID=A0A443ILR6_9RHOB|nr:hypothetical protein [Sinirhodobacter populi]RWR05947.1 hypothetical protein D2T33_19150 [Sinirhodobacter populi]
MLAEAARQLGRNPRERIETLRLSEEVAYKTWGCSGLGTQHPIGSQLARNHRHQDLCVARSSSPCYKLTLLGIRASGASRAGHHAISAIFARMHGEWITVCGFSRDCL